MKRSKATAEKAILVSDLHMDRWSGERRLMFLEFLDYVEKTATEFYVLGDILDFPAMPGRRVWPDHSEVILRAIKLSKTLPVTYVVGNHDSALRAVEIDEMGFRATQVDAMNPMIREMGDFSVYLEHGHDYDPLYREHVYDALNLLDRIFGAEFENLASDMWQDVLHVFNRRHGARESEPGVPESLLKMWERAAEQILKKRRCNLVIFGHTHAPMIVRMLSDNQYYVNTGDWLKHSTYVEIKGNRTSLMEWPGKNVISEIRLKKKK